MRGRCKPILNEAGALSLFVPQWATYRKKLPDDFYWSLDEGSESEASRGMWARSWQRQTGRPTFALDAVLVESVRISGKPRQKFVAHLTHIPEPLMSMGLHRGIFWEEVNARFDELNLDETLRAKVTGKLLETIPFCDEAKRYLEQQKQAR